MEIVRFLQLTTQSKLFRIVLRMNFTLSSFLGLLPQYLCINHLISCQVCFCNSNISLLNCLCSLLDSILLNSFACIRHIEDLKQNAAVYDSLVVLVEKLIQNIKEAKSLEQVFLSIETLATIIDLCYVNAPKNNLFERIVPMSEERLSNVRIVRLPAMTVASYCAESASPEDDCFKVHSKFVLENNLHKWSGFRQFGFNNPSPTEDNPIYGYECWVTIPDDFHVPAPFTKKQFSGGLYASISTDMNEIGERWQMLFNWCKNSDKYDIDFSCQWLEECSMDYETFISGKEQQLDLLVPINIKSDIALK